MLLSGTMGNLIGVLAQTQRGDEVILGDAAHIGLAESAGSAVIGGIQLRPLPTYRGCFDLADIAEAIRPLGDVHQPPSTLLCLENTHNRDGGVPVTAADTRAMAHVAHEHGLRVHLDGARLFNAAGGARRTGCRSRARHGLGDVLPVQGAGVPDGIAVGR